MAAYIIASIDVTDPAAYEEYRRQAPDLIAAHGGRYLVRGGASERLEGDAEPHRLVILEFPDMTMLRAFYDSPAYRGLRALRQQAAVSSLFAVQGV